MMACNNNQCIIIILIAILLVHVSSSQTASGHGHDDHGEIRFSYAKESHDGPDKWGTLHPNYTDCNAGDRQSPIDLNDNDVQATSSLGELVQKYKLAPAALFNKGHVLQVMWKEDAGKIVINGTDYTLLQAHWHTPSETTGS